MLATKPFILLILPQLLLASEVLDVDVPNNVVRVNGMAFQKKLPVVVRPPHPPFVYSIGAFSCIQSRNSAYGLLKLPG